MDDLSESNYLSATPFRTQEHGLLLALIAVLVWAPLPFASARPWGESLLVLLLAALAGIWALLWLVNRTAVYSRSPRPMRAALAILLSVQLLCAAQLIPLHMNLRQVLAPLAAQWQPAPMAPLSLAPADTLAQLQLGLGLCGVFFLVAVLVNSVQRLRLVLAALMVSGLVQALYGVFMVLSGLEWGFLVEKYAGRGLPTGTFINRNHFAAYLVLCLGAGIGLMLSRAGQPLPSSHWRGWLRYLLQLLLGDTLRLRIALLLMVIALVMSASRGGNAAFLGALTIAGLAHIMSGQKQLRARTLWLLASILLVDVLIISRWFGLDRLTARLRDISTTSVGEDYRGRLFTVLEHYLRDALPGGSGAGSFATVFPNYQPAGLEGFVRHAHNDYLQFTLELGIPGAALLCAFLVIVLMQTLRRLRSHHRAERAGAFAALMALLWLLHHSVADFGLRIPALSVTVMALLALPFATLKDDGSGRRKARGPRRRSALGHPALRSWRDPAAPL